MISKNYRSNPVQTLDHPRSSLGEIVESASRKKKKEPPVENHSTEDCALFVDLVHKMLAYEPSKRITPHEALDHPFISEQKAQERLRMQVDIRHLHSLQSQCIIQDPFTMDLNTRLKLPNDQLDKWLADNRDKIEASHAVWKTRNRSRLRDILSFFRRTPPHPNRP